MEKLLTYEAIDIVMTRNEKNQILAFDSGYEKSKTAVIDANITTLIAAIILFLMGSGPIKGFSITRYINTPPTAVEIKHNKASKSLLKFTPIQLINL